MRTLVLFAIASLVIGGFMTNEVARWCAAEKGRPGQTIRQPGLNASADEDALRLDLDMDFAMEAGLPLRSHRWSADVDLDLANLNDPQLAVMSGPKIMPVGFVANTVVYAALLFVGCLGVMRLTGGKRRPAD